MTGVKLRRGRRAGYSAQPASAGDHPTASASVRCPTAPSAGGHLHEALCVNAQTPVPDQVIFCYDFPAWQRTRSERDRRLVGAMMAGERTWDVTARYGLSPAPASRSSAAASSTTGAASVRLLRTAGNRPPVDNPTPPADDTGGRGRRLIRPTRHEPIFAMLSSSDERPWPVR